uniref:Ran guanine nucleotide release factor n=1 Tax=Leptobrachium leishanense TaxID=445787 RepID=A0A8C5MHX9_9ANUR
MDAVTDKRPLYGGAFSAILPDAIQDVSDLREIPDNQEVFAHASTDQSIIVELLEYQEGMTDTEAARYHFEDVASGNSAEGRSEVLSVEPFPLAQLSLTNCASAWALTGLQQVAKFNEEALNTVNIYLVLCRLPHYSTDLLVTFNDPIVIDPFSSSAVGGAAESSLRWTVEDLHRLVSSLQLNDPGIFS